MRTEQTARANVADQYSKLIQLLSTIGESRSGCYYGVYMPGPERQHEIYRQDQFGNRYVLQPTHCLEFNWGYVGQGAWGSAVAIMNDFSESGKVPKSALPILSRRLQNEVIAHKQQDEHFILTDEEMNTLCAKWMEENQEENEERRGARL